MTPRAGRTDASAQGPDRARAGRFGRQAEWRAAVWLRVKGYRLLARNYAVQGGEIDLIVRRGDTIAFVEVKARPRLEEALVAISSTKRRRIQCAARVWLAHNPRAASLVLRGDGVFVAPRRLPRHIVDAFPLDLV